MQRMGWVIGIRPERIREYKALHAAAWPEVLAMITACGIRNYTIYLREPENLLFAHFEYHGEDFEADMARMRANDATQRWWAVTGPCQEPLTSRREGEWWAPMEEVFHHG
jgi:L-rhamnose mutarotase